METEVRSLLKRIALELRAAGTRTTSPGHAGGNSWSFTAVGPTSTATLTVDLENEDGDMRPTFEVTLDRAPHSHTPAIERLLTLGDDARPVRMGDRAAARASWAAFKAHIKPRSVARLVREAMARTASPKSRRHGDARPLKDQAPLPPPVASFTSSHRRRFTVGRGKHWESYPGDPHWFDDWPVLYKGKLAGSLTRSLKYGKDKPRWQASPRNVPHTAELPIGIGFDVGPFDTAKETLAAWSRKADEILDFDAGKRVPSIYSKTGAVQRGTTQGFRSWPPKGPTREPFR